MYVCVCVCVCVCVSIFPKSITIELINTYFFTLRPFFSPLFFVSLNAEFKIFLKLDPFS